MRKTPQSIILAARERIKASKPQRDRVLAATEAGQPLIAEEDEPRKLRRIQSLTGLSPTEAERLARNEAPEQFGLAGEKRFVVESIQGKTANFVSVSFLELARAAASAVGRITLWNMQPLGTGVLISNRLLLTNHHVIPSLEDAHRFLVEFDYELAADGRPKDVTRFALAPEVFFLTSPEDDLDFTITAIGDQVLGDGKLQSFGSCPLFDDGDRHVLSEFVNLVQHPEGDYKQVTLRENQIVARLGRVLHYVADTLPGSSGSPVFNDQWELIALHHWGEPFTETREPDGRPVRIDVNEGIRVSSIIEEIRRRKEELSTAQWELVERALNPLPARSGGKKEKIEAIETTNGSDDAEHERILTWTIPLTVSVNLGALSSNNNPADDTDDPPEGEDQIDAVVEIQRSKRSKRSGRSRRGGAAQIDRDYSNRPGYTPDFLPGHPVPLPALPAELRSHAAPLLRPAAGEDPYELKYQHFSIVMNASRRMAFFTAVIIDGATWTPVDRKTGRAQRNAAETREPWFTDPRIDAGAQCADDLYLGQRPHHRLDRGHLVRRQDPTWGTAARAERASADTFHFTNCTPQHSVFNQAIEYWQGIEAYILDNVKAERERVLVFTGPVFSDDDPEYRYVRIPLAFWKIVARVENDRLLATALLADQSAMLTRIPADLGPNFNQLGQVAEFQTSIREIERLTRIDFGPLRDGDTCPDETLRSRKALRSFADLSLDPVH